MAAWAMGGATAVHAAGDEDVLAEAAALREAGKFDEALDALRTQSREIKKLAGEESPRLLPINDLAAEILVDSGDLDTAGPLLDKTIAARRKLVAAGRRDQLAPLGGSLRTLARLETAAQRLPAATDAARRALVAFGSAPEPDAERIVRARDELKQTVGALDAMLGPGAAATRTARTEAAAAFASLGMFSEAIQERHQVLSTLLAQQPAPAADIREASVGLGQLMMVAGRADEALPIVETSLAALEATSAPDAGAVRRLLADLQLAADMPVRAEGTCGAVLEAGRAAGKPPPITDAGDRLRSLLVAVRRGRATAVPEWFEPTVKSLAVGSKPAADVPEALAGLVVASRVHEALGAPAAAAAVLGQALGLALGMKAPDAGAVADISGRLAAAQLAAGDVAAARKTIEKSLPAAERDAGPGDARVALLRILLADVLQRSGDSDKAVAVAVEALDRGLPRPDDAWEERATAIYDRLAAGAGHEDLREKYLAARTAQFGARHPHVASACSLFGVARLAVGDWPTAVALLSRALDQRRAGLGDEHPDVAASLVLRAHAERMAGEPKRAVETAARGLAAWERAAGPDHPGTLSAADVLVAAKVDAGDSTGVAELLERLCAANAIEDPVRRAGHLVRLADLVAGKDKAKAKELLDRAMQLPCWQGKEAPGQAARLRLALTAALAAHAFRASGATAESTDALQLARSLALDDEDPKPLLDRIERIAAGGEQPSGVP